MENIYSNDDVTKELYSYIGKTAFSNKFKEKLKDKLDVVLLSGENDINLDFDDLKMILSHEGVIFVGSGSCEGDNSVIKAIHLSMKDASSDFNTLKEAIGLLVHFTIHPDFPILEIVNAMELLTDQTSSESDIVYGTTTDKLVSKSYVKATILFTGVGTINEGEY